MPIKLPKGLKVRRRSSVQALDEVENPPPPPLPTFRLIDREPGGSKSLDGFSGGKKFAQQLGRPSSYGAYDFGADDVEPLSENPNKRYPGRSTAYGRGTTENHRKSYVTVDSYSSGPANNSAASSMRLSSASTVPSSTDLSLEAQKTFVPRKPVAESSSTPRPPSRAGHDSQSSEKPFEHGPRTKTSASSGASSNITQVRRSRAMTASSASTATPPKLLESELSRGSDMDGLSNMFDSLKGPDGDSNHLKLDFATPVSSPSHLCKHYHANGYRPSLRHSQQTLPRFEKTFLLETETPLRPSQLTEEERWRSLPTPGRVIIQMTVSSHLQVQLQLIRPNPRGLGFHMTISRSFIHRALDSSNAQTAPSQCCETRHPF